MRSVRVLLLIVLIIVGSSTAVPQEIAGPDEQQRSGQRVSPSLFSGLRLRLIGPAMISGRVIGFAVDPTNRSRYYVAAASGGVWQTTNNGTSWTPVFDSQGSYSIGAIALDPKNPATVWVGTGENNSQRSVSYGDGIYRSDDGGKTWRNLGLKKSEHIAKILIDPRDSDVVYVASQGPLWGPGGDRGLFKTTDGGKTWKAVLAISENTGVTDIAQDPIDPDVLYAASYQRRRHVWTLIDGGPESAIYKSIDGGANWNKVRSGLPAEHMGRIGLAISPVAPSVLYATIEAANRRGGIFRSTDRGATWERRNEFDSTAMYYGKIFADPKDVGRIYVMNVRIMVSDDGGRTLRPLGERSKHVDNHAIWVDPSDTNHYLVGCDGGVYESFDQAANWSFKANLPLGQFYDVAVDNSKPFYYVYGGTQDNNSVGAPSRTANATGITNADWFVTQGGDGFRTHVDPEDPNTVYSELQHGVLVRYDRRTGERIGVQPKVGKNEPPLRWNWDSPFIISPHLHTRLYFAANKLFRSDDRGDSWRAISGELSREIDRNKLPVMGRVWGPDAVAKNASTSFYGNAVALAESPKKEGLIYVGTDDGLIQITEDGGKNWRKAEQFTGVPEMTYVSRIIASQHDANTVYASFDNHKNNDFAPYILKSTDTGKTWASIKADLPANGPVLAIAEDHVDPNLLFLGTEFGLFFTNTGAQKWIQLKSGFPTIAVRDLAIQRRENDLVVGTFGRGIYILDDYTPLRSANTETLAKAAALFAVKNALLFMQSSQYGGRGKAFQGESFFTAENPPYGAVFTYYLKESLKTKKQVRQEAERAAERISPTGGTNGEQKREPVVPPYPTRDQLRAEEEEEPSRITLTVSDSAGKVVRRLTGPMVAGVHRVAWDLRYPAPSVSLQQQRPAEEGGDEFRQAPSGPIVAPGRFTVSLSKTVDGVTTELAGPQSFSVVVDETLTMPAADLMATTEFQQKLYRLQRSLNGALETANATKTRLAQIKRALQETPSAAADPLIAQATSLDKRMNEILRTLRGDSILRARNENTPPSIMERVNGIAGELRASTSKPTRTQAEQYSIAAEEFSRELASLKALVEGDLARLEKAMEATGAPWTPGRIPDWKQ